MIVNCNDKAAPPVDHPGLHEVGTLGIDFNDYVRSLYLERLPTGNVRGQKCLLLADRLCEIPVKALHPFFWRSAPFQQTLYVRSGKLQGLGDSFDSSNISLRLSWIFLTVS